MVKTPFKLPNRERESPTRLQAAAFFAKAWVFRVRRFAGDPNGTRPRRLEKKGVAKSAPVLAESHCTLYGSVLPAEFALQAGKVANLRVAGRYLNGLVMPAGELFSFWAHVPRPTRGLGFVQGRELREGCVIPSIGGGLCQLSNALYDAALNAGFEIVERHATIFWNYVDLRWRAKTDCQLEVTMDSGELVVRVRSLTLLTSNATSSPRAVFPGTGTRPAEQEVPVESCETCGMTNCFRHAEIPSLPKEAVTAWLVDAWWPEHDDYLVKNRRAGDWLFTPLDSRKYGVGPYHWSSQGFAKVRQEPWFVIERSLRSRKLAAQGAARQRALLEMDEKLALRYLRRLTFTATHLVISQNLLPFLWKEGALGGRTYDVLMTRLPLAELHGVLDRAEKRWPESPTLADFRAAEEIVEAETAALAGARQWITPHSAIARLAGSRAVKLAWHFPQPQKSVMRADAGAILSPASTRSSAASMLLFPASTLGRKGAYEVREAARALGLRVALGGPVLEDEGFWSDVQTVRVDMSGDALPQEIKVVPDGTVAVVLPAWVENQPRRLLKAAAAGIPVVASEQCGLAGVPGVIEVPAGDVDALKARLGEILERSGAASGVVKI